MDSNDVPPSSGALPAFRKVIWLLPVAYLLHIAEEYLGGFPEWVTRDVHGRFDDTAFVINNVAFMVILLTLVYANFEKATLARSLLLVGFASANLFWDALFHLAMTPLLNRYSPGLMTAMLLHYPLCLLIGVVIVKQQILTRRQFVLTLLAGLALFALVVWYGLFHFAMPGV